MTKHQVSNNKRYGYSFIELLAAVSIMGIIIVGFSRLFMTSLIGEKKAKNLEEIKQNGNYILAVMSNMIRNAQEIQSSCGVLSDSITILNQDGRTTTFSCLNQDAPDPDQIASNTANLIDNEEIEIGNCDSIFNCQPGDGESSIVKINFTLSRGEAGSPREFVSQSFQTTVSLRNY